MSSTIDDEKAYTAGLERKISDESTASEDLINARIAAFTPEQQRRIVWRIDRRLVVLLGFMYCVSLMDRTNMVSLAKHCSSDSCTN